MRWTPAQLVISPGILVSIDRSKSSSRFSANGGIPPPTSMAATDIGMKFDISPAYGSGSAQAALQ